MLRLAFIPLFCLISAAALEPIPAKLVVLTFDDSVASQFTVVRPLLKEYKFGATFFISEGFGFPTNKTDYMTWEQIAQLHADGFEIGNHTRDHMSVIRENLSRLKEQIETVNTHLAEHGIPRPTSFAWPGNVIDAELLPNLKALGFRFARRGGAPEYSYTEGRGVAFEPGLDHPLLIPSAGDSRPAWHLEDFKLAVTQAKPGRIAVLQFHGVPDRDHPWVNTPVRLFREYLKFLHTENFQVIALRDLSRYVDPDKTPAQPMSIIITRQKSIP
jgi:peptidoglycan/xylan/chitin deacetylase (PgdA/CDA1 family)